MTTPAASGAPSAVNIPNALTTLRLVLVPVFGWLLMADGGTNSTYRSLSALVFLIASITDYFDGYLARRYDIVTTFGKVADPIADKSLTGVALIGLSLLGELPWWVTAVILLREAAVTIIRFAVIRDGVIPASRGGKAKTVTQMGAIVMYLLPLSGWLMTARTMVLALAIVLTVATGIDYVFRALALHRNAALRNEAFGDDADDF
jgi:CDP-diacylglycerol---glycerol-3-phosphate 3-phosphatidyltransferase